MNYGAYTQYKITMCFFYTFYTKFYNKTGGFNIFIENYKKIKNVFRGELLFFSYRKLNKENSGVANIFYKKL